MKSSRWSTIGPCDWLWLWRYTTELFKTCQDIAEATVEWPEGYVIDHGHDGDDNCDTETDHKDHDHVFFLITTMCLSDDCQNYHLTVIQHMCCAIQRMAFPPSHQRVSTEQPLCFALRASCAKHQRPSVQGWDILVSTSWGRVGFPEGLWFIFELFLFFRIWKNHWPKR